MARPSAVMVLGIRTWILNTKAQKKRNYLRIQNTNTKDTKHTR